MGHQNGKDIYRELGRKIDNLTVRVPWNNACYEILKELYSTEEADVVIRMPYSLSNLDRIVMTTKYEKEKLHRILDGLCSKGLVVDIFLNDEYLYMPSPLIIGIFEFTMMRTGENIDSKKWARLLSRYFLSDDGAFYSENAKKGDKISLFRALPHEGTIDESNYIEVLDYERAGMLIEGFDKFSIGICSCRHEKFHIDEKGCETPLETCSSFGFAADYLIRNNMAKEVAKSEMIENIHRSKESGLVFIADNVRKNITFICHCCSCCCNILMGINRFGCNNILITSSYIANINEELCSGCGKCSEACPINAIELVLDDPSESKKKMAQIDTSICIGCGVCCLSCKKEALKLVNRKKRIIPPETTFERTILQCLEKGTLQNQLLDNPESRTQDFMRILIGAFLQLPPVKRALMSDVLRSTFLRTMKMGAKLQGKGWVLEL